MADESSVPGRISCQARWANFRRMNVGQILEPHVWALAAGLGEKINRISKIRQGPPSLREFLMRSTTRSVGPSGKLDELSDQEIIELSKNCAGVACPWQQRYSMVQGTRRSSTNAAAWRTCRTPVR